MAKSNNRHPHPHPNTRMKAPQVKQYYITPAYTDNYHVIEVVDGKIEDDNIVVTWELSALESYLQGKGYKKACYVPHAEQRMNKAKEIYEAALAEYNAAVANPLNVSDADAKKCHALSKEIELDYY